MHEKSHRPVVVLQNSDAFCGGFGQGVHDVPHELTEVSSSHAVPPRPSAHAWKPPLHATPQPVGAPLHTAPPLPFEGGGQMVPQLTQLLGSVCRLVHVPVQRSGVGGEQPVTHA